MLVGRKRWQTVVLRLRVSLEQEESGCWHGTKNSRRRIEGPDDDVYARAKALCTAGLLNELPSQCQEIGIKTRDPKVLRIDVGSLDYLFAVTISAADAIACFGSVWSGVTVIAQLAERIVRAAANQVRGTDSDVDLRVISPSEGHRYHGLTEVSLDGISSSSFPMLSMAVCAICAVLSLVAALVCCFCVHGVAGANDENPALSVIAPQEAGVSPGVSIDVW